MNIGKFFYHLPLVYKFKCKKKCLLFQFYDHTMSKQTNIPQYFSSIKKESNSSNMNSTENKIESMEIDEDNGSLRLQHLLNQQPEPPSQEQMNDSNELSNSNNSDNEINNLDIKKGPKELNNKVDVDIELSKQEKSLTVLNLEKPKPFVLDMDKLKKFQAMRKDNLPPMRESSEHVFLFKLPITENGPIIPDPDHWENDAGFQRDRNCVIMPHSSHNVMITHDDQQPYQQAHQQQQHYRNHHQHLYENSRKVNRWKVVKSSLENLRHRNDRNAIGIQEAIQKYHKRKQDFTTLLMYFELMDREKSVEFFEIILPGMIELVLNSEFICTKPIPILNEQQNSSVSMSQHQAACILANAFFCTFPSTDRGQLPEINFFGLYKAVHSNRKRSNLSKLDCLVNYFRRVVRSEAGDGVLTFTRQVIDPKTTEEWKISKTKLRDLLVSSEGLIEKEGEGMLQVDFANKFVGGGVLRTGCVQEEIRFITCPEAIVSCLMTKCLQPNECLIMKGIETYSSYKGYSDKFRFDGDFVDCIPRDSWRRRQTELVAMDALSYDKPLKQFDDAKILRELNKSYCGFMSSEPNLPPVATGNWGCGAFRGNVELKAMIQLMSASEAGRDVCYLTFGDAQLAEKMYHLHQSLVEKGTSVGDLWNYITLYKPEADGPSLFNFIEDFL